MARGSLGSAYRAGDTEIRHQRVARVEQDVGRFDVAVNHVAAVGIAQRVRHLARDLERLGHRELPFAEQALAQRLTLDVGHDIVKQPVGLIGVVERQDVRVVEPGGDLDLAEETGCPDIRGDIGSKHLHGNGALVLEVVGQEDFRHPSLSQFPLDLIAGRQRLAQAFKEPRHYPATPLDVRSTSFAVAIGAPCPHIVQDFPRVEA